MSDPRENELERLTRALARVEDVYDDLGRARAESRLRLALGVRAPRRLRMFAVAGAAALAVGLVAAFVLVRPRPPSWAAAPTLRPYLVAPVEGGAATVAPALVDGPTLDVPAGWVVRASLNDGITVGVVGPARLAVAGTSSDPELHLEGGRALVDVTPNRGLRLRVSTARLALTVIGTLFSVDASEVNVVHGRVRVSANGVLHEVDGGRRWRVSSPVLEELDVGAAAALDAHHAASPPSPGAVTIGVAGEPAGAEIWLGGRRLAVAPASLRAPVGVPLEIRAPGRTSAELVVPATPTTIAYSLAPTVTRDEHAEDHREPRRAARPLPSAPRAAAAAPAPAQDVAQNLPNPRDLYHDADRALAAGDRDGARAALLGVVRAGGDDGLTDAANLELATLALQAGEHEAARRYLGGIHGDAVAQPAALLGCEIDVAARDLRAADCFAAFRSRFPSSAHEGEVLGEEAVMRADQNDCAHARPLLEAASARTLPAKMRDAVRARLARCKQ
jgi:hypothetical protein